MVFASRVLSRSSQPPPRIIIPKSFACFVCFVISVGMIMERFKCKMIISIFVFPHFSYAWRTVSTSSTMLQNLETAAKIYLKSSRASNKISERFPRRIFQIEMLSVEIFHGEEIHFREIRFHSQPWLSRVELFRKHGKKIWLQVVRWIAFEALAWSLKIHEIYKLNEWNECEKSLRNWFLNWRFLLSPVESR